MKLRLAGIGLLLATTFSSNIMAGENAVGVAITKAELENTRLDTGFKLFATIMPSDNVGVEFAHGEYGELGDVDFSSTNIALVAATSGGTANVYGKLGLAFWSAKIDDWYYGSETVSGEDLMVGLGLNVRAGDALVKFEVEGIDADGADVVSLNIGLGVAF